MMNPLRKAAQPLVFLTFKFISSPTTLMPPDAADGVTL